VIDHLSHEEIATRMAEVDGYTPLHKDFGGKNIIQILARLMERSAF
jgi:hypothetical protein